MLSFSLLSHSGLEKKNVTDGMLTAFQILHAKMPFTPTVTALFSFALLLHQNKGGGEGKREREKKQIEGFLYIFKLELSYVIIFRVKCICQITDFEFVLGIHKTIKNFNPTGNV